METTKSTPAPTPAKTSKKVTFFSLPGELRNDVYAQVLTQKSAIVLNKYRLARLVTHGPPALVRADPRLTKECHRIYFEDNTFCFEDETLHTEDINTFADVLGNQSCKALTKIAIRRSYRIADMDPIKIRFLVEIINGRIEIIRPTNENRPFPGVSGYAKFKDPYTEPCRCDVRRMAFKHGSGKTKAANGYDLLRFLDEYVEAIREKARNPSFRVCKTCNSVRRV